MNVDANLMMLLMTFPVCRKGISRHLQRSHVVHLVTDAMMNEMQQATESKQNRLT